MPEIAAKIVSSVVDNVTKKSDATVGRVTADAVAKSALSKDTIQKTVAKIAATPAPVADLPKVKISNPLSFIVSAPGAKIDAPRLSPDNKSVTYVMRETKDVPTFVKRILGLDPKAPTERMTAWVAPVDGSKAPVKIAGGTFDNVVEPAFSPDGKSVIYAEQKYKPFLAYGEKLKAMKLQQVELSSGKVTTMYNGDLTLLHPQYSPDGKLIAAYSRDKGKQGIYLLDPAAKPGTEPTRITVGDDKHPVWTQDGKRIYFHNQVGGDAVSASADGNEQAWLGYVDLTDPKAPKKVMLDNTRAETYHKHPTPIPNSDLIVYHNDNHKLEVMNVLTGQRANLKLEGISPNGTPLKNFKHAAVGADGQDMLVVAKGKGSESLDRGIPENWRVYMLQNAQQIKQAFAQTFPG